MIIKKKFGNLLVWHITSMQQFYERNVGEMCLKVVISQGQIV